MEANEGPKIGSLGEKGLSNTIVAILALDFVVAAHANVAGYYCCTVGIFFKQRF